MATDKDESTNKEVERSKEYQERIDIKEKTIEVAKKLLESTTDEEFEKLGYEKVEGYAGVYGTGKKYGAGAVGDKYTVQIEGVTTATLTKKTTLGTKRVQADINFSFKNNVVEIEYKIPEQGSFRGAKKGGDSYAIAKQILVKDSEMKESNKELKEFFKYAANKEVGYLTSTRLGVDDKLSKSTTSTVNENTMEKLTLKSLFADDFNINESKEEKDTNTTSMKDVDKSDKNEKGKDLFFDEKKEEKTKKTIAERDAEIKSEVTMSGPAISGSAGGFKDGAASGAGGYNTPNAFKKEKGTAEFESTNYAKNKRSKRPKIDENYNIVNEDSEASRRTALFNPLTSTKGNSSDFWQVVKIDPSTHPLGLPGIKPNSAEELKINSNGMDKDKMRRIGLKEETNRKVDLTQKKIFSEEENKLKGINKRYLITEKTSDEYLKERWAKLSLFKLNESIAEAEESTSLFKEMEDERNNPVLDVTAADIRKKEDERYKSDRDLTDMDTIKMSENLFEDNHPRMKDTTLNEETIEVEKPGSLFGISYNFYKKDFLNESSKYILDLNSRVFVPNPNAK